MAKLSVSESVTLDGVMEGPSNAPEDATFKYAGWTTPYFDEDVMRYVSENTSREGALLLGRVTYEMFAAAWTRQTGPVADFMNNCAKYVVSTTLKKAEWNNSTLISGNIPEEIARLKQSSAKDLAILGSGTLVRSLMPYDLIDEYALLVYPVVVGMGKRLFDGATNAPLKLKHSKQFGSGVMFLSYVPDRK